MHELVLALARITGVELALDPLTQQELQQSRVALVRDAPVPGRRSVRVRRELPGPPGLRAVRAQARRTSDPRRVRPGVATVEHSRAAVRRRVDLPLLEDHAALFVRVVVTFRNIDTRQLQTQLRQLLVDASGLRQCVPAGERSLILQGLGRETLSLVQLLREVDAASVAPSAPAPAPEAK
jgi:hypothetical protein